MSIFSSNGGVFGSLYGTPIINLPQAAVLGAFRSLSLGIMSVIYLELFYRHAHHQGPRRCG